MSNWGRIAVGVRLTRCEPEFFVSWTNLLCNGLRSGDAVLPPAVDLPHAAACNFLVKNFATAPCDALCLIDDDQDFPADALNRLRESGDGFDILTAVIVARRPPFLPLILRDDKSVLGMSGCQEVTHCGLGFTLIRRSVLAPMIDEPFRWDMSLGEDGAFSEDVRKAGRKIGVNCDLCVGHVARHTLVWNNKKKAADSLCRTFGVVRQSQPRTIKE